METRPAVPAVSVVIPARNEEDNIAGCLASLYRQGQGIEIIVADDGSQDRTAEVIRQLLASAPVPLTVVQVPPLPKGWTGKNHALTAGVERARGHWLLFTDADTRHAPGKLQEIVDRAGREGLDLLSFSPRQEARTWWEKAVIPQVYLALGKLYPYWRVNDPSDPMAAANGQYILIRSEVYEKLGGHAALPGALLDDVELAQRAKQAGFRIWFGSGEGVVSTRMYSRFRQMWEGWTKNLFPLYNRDHRAIARARRALALRFVSLPVAGLLFSVLGSRAVAGIGLALLAFSFWEHVRYAQKLPQSQKAAAALLVPGALLFLLLLWDSERRYRSQKGIEWRGRHYKSVA
ncbi:MAG: glycosyltransferase [Acidobacteria bacterium]|nr:glycosyltransferase [Acidobacteriota bacterium]